MNKALKKEGENGHLNPKVRANSDLLDRLLHRHLVTQQDVGLEPKLTPTGTEAKGDGGSATDNATNRALAEIVNRLVKLPDDQYIPTLVALIGPAPDQATARAGPGRCDGDREPAARVGPEWCRRRIGPWPVFAGSSSSGSWYTSPA